MCGITGIIVNSEQNKYFELLRASEIRGQDGTGIVILRNRLFYTWRWKHKASLITDFPKLLPGDLVIGQNRLAIFGLDHRNDQPLIGQHNAIVHNGNLRDFEGTFAKLGLRREFDVDTELLLRLFEADVVPSSSRWYELVKGNYACLLLNTVHNKLITFSEDKPIYQTIDKEGSTYFFSTPRIGRKVFDTAIWPENETEACNTFGQYFAQEK